METLLYIKVKLMEIFPKQLIFRNQAISLKFKWLEDQLSCFEGFQYDKSFEGIWRREEEEQENYRHAVASVRRRCHMFVIAVLKENKECSLFLEEK